MSKTKEKKSVVDGKGVNGLVKDNLSAFTTHQKAGANVLGVGKELFIKYVMEFQSQFAATILPMAFDKDCPECFTMLFEKGMVMNITGEQFVKYVQPYCVDYVDNRGGETGDGVKASFVKKIRDGFDEDAMGIVTIAVVKDKSLQELLTGKNVPLAVLPDGSILVIVDGHHRAKVMESPNFADEKIALRFISGEKHYKIYSRMDDNRSHNASKIYTMKSLYIGKFMMELAEQVIIPDYFGRELLKRLNVISGFVHMMSFPEECKPVGNKVPFNFVNFAKIESSPQSKHILYNGLSQSEIKIRSGKYKRILDLHKKHSCNSSYLAHRKSIEKYTNSNDTVPIAGKPEADKLLSVLKEWYDVVTEFEKTTFFQTVLMMKEKEKNSGKTNKPKKSTATVAKSKTRCAVYNSSQFLFTYLHDTLFCDGELSDMAKNNRPLLIERMEDAYYDIENSMKAVSYRLDGGCSEAMYCRYTYPLVYIGKI